MIKQLSYFPLKFLGHVFQKHAAWWSSRHKGRYQNKSLMENVLQLFYIDYLRVSEEKCEVVEISQDKLITRCTNKCPIYGIARFLHLDTQYVCKLVSEPACKSFLKNLNPDLEFIRNYNKIRPHASSCEETIKLKYL